MKENFDTQSYRDNLAKDLKSLRKEDPKLATELLESEKEFSKKYSESELAQIEKRKEAREKSPLLKELREKDENKRYEAQEKYIMERIESGNKSLQLIEKHVLDYVHPVLGKEKDRFIYENYFNEGSSGYYSYLNAILDEKIIMHSEMPKGASLKIIDESLHDNPYHTTKEAISSFLSHHPEFQESFNDKKITMVKNGELYFSGDFLQVFSKDKDALLNFMKEEGINESLNSHGDWEGYW